MPVTSYIILLLGAGMFLALFYIYPIVPRGLAFLHSFLLPVSVVCKGNMPIMSYIILLLGAGIFLALFYIYPIVPRGLAFLHSFLFPVSVVKGICP